MKRLEVHKFGGSSVGDAARIASVAGLVTELARDRALVVVASAMTGVTDGLVQAASEAARGQRDDALGRVDAIRERHLRALAVLGGADGGDEARAIHALCSDLAEILRAVHLLGDAAPRTRDRIVASGEKLAVHLVALALRSAGTAGVACAADTFLETDDRFGEASALPVVADRTIAAALRPLLDRGDIPVVTGFIGRAPDGATTTLGRGGSDLTATILAASLRADEVTLWSDVDGVFSADPRVVPEARVIRQINFREAAEMSYYGAKVLHQRTMIPVAELGIPVRARNSFAPERDGTVVDGRFTPGSHPVKAVTAIRDQSLISIEGKGMSGVPGVAARVFGALAERGISVTMISQSSSESSICLVLPTVNVVEAETALKREFRADLSKGDVDEIAVRRGAGIVAAVGLGMAQTPGVAGRVFHALGARRINILAIAQGSSELNISLAVEPAQIDDAVRVLHGEFGLDRVDTGEDTTRRLDLMILGAGKIGRALAALVFDRNAHFFERFGLEPRVIGLADRSGYVLRPNGIPEEELRGLLDAKAAGRAVAACPGGIASSDPGAFIGAATAFRLARPVLVDTSDADGSERAFLEALHGGCDVVTANKKPLAGSLASFRELRQAAASAGRLLKAEATVGAGLPVMDTLEMLLGTGDRLTKAEGCLSGTLGFLMARLEEGMPFSQAVAAAVELGYTEPDPVADLSGADVARKATILGRLAGLAEADEPVRPESLVDPALGGLPVDELLAKLEAYDAPMAARVAAAKKEGKVVRYVATVAPALISVGPVAVPADSPAGRLQGTDNMIAFTTERYASRPLVVMGPGAGVEVTAMGVLGDILRVAAERR